MRFQINFKQMTLSNKLMFVSAVITLILAVPGIYSFLHGPDEKQATASSTGTASPVTVAKGNHNAVIQTHGESSSAANTAGDNSPVTFNNYYYVGNRQSAEQMKHFTDSIGEPGKTERPDVDATLIVTDVISNTAHIAFRIRNNSSFFFKDLRFIDFSPIGSGVHTHKGATPYCLQPGKDIVLEPYKFGPGLTVSPSNSPTSSLFALSVDYDAIVGSSTNHMNCHFGFALFNMSLEVGEFKPIGFKRGSGVFTDQEISNMIHEREALTAPTAVMSFWFEPEDDPTNQLLFFIRSPDRALFYIPDERRFCFRTRLSNGNEMVLIQNLEGLGWHDTGWHYIAAQWTPEDAGLMVDAKGKWTKPNK